MTSSRPFDLHTFLVGKLRSATRQCPRFSAVKSAARVSVRTENYENTNGKWIRSVVINGGSNGHNEGEVVLTKSYKNAANRDRVMFNCAECNKLFFDYEYLPVKSKSGGGVTRYKKKCVIAIDHIEPCVDPKTGFVDWNTYIDRMFNGELQILCNYPGERDGAKSCHALKTKREREIRKLK